MEHCQIYKQNILDSKYVAWILAVLNTASSLTLSPSATAFLE